MTRILYYKIFPQECKRCRFTVFMKGFVLFNKGNYYTDRDTALIFPVLN